MLDTLCKRTTAILAALYDTSEEIATEFWDTFASIRAAIGDLCGKATRAIAEAFTPLSCA